jgi:hypothetical protein
MISALGMAGFALLTNGAVSRCISLRLLVPHYVAGASLAGTNCTIRVQRQRKLNGLGLDKLVRI